MVRGWLAGLGLFLLAPWLSRAGEPVTGPPCAEDRALHYLADEVPRWKADNRCYSCHNNGDGARALYVAHRRHYGVPARSLEDTSRWLARPEVWDKNGGADQASDKALARLQFAAALAEAVDAGLVKGKDPLFQAAALVAKDQHADGFWSSDRNLGSPVTYGTCLATFQARRVLQSADPAKYRDALERSDRWARKTEVRGVLDAAGILLILGKQKDAGAEKQRRRCVDLIRKGQSKDGGWGPYVNSGPEAFDTAVVMLALKEQPEHNEIRDWLRRGRAYLVRTQEMDGSWPETTRPTGARSYAQRLSTAAWATLALIATAPK